MTFEWRAAGCPLVPAELASTLGLACLVLAVLVVAAVAAGFVPLWAGWRARRRAAGATVRAYGGGSLETWRLYRELGRAAPPQPVARS